MSYSKHETFKCNRRGRMLKIQYMSVKEWTNAYFLFENEMRNWTIREQHDCHWHFVDNQHISWQGVSSILIFPTALYYVNIPDVVYMHVSMVIKQNVITRVCIIRCLNKNLYMRCPYLACQRRHRTPKRRWLLSYPLQKIQLPSLAAFFINGYLNKSFQWGSKYARGLVVLN